jgi:hypothetical protein
MQSGTAAGPVARGQYWTVVWELEPSSRALEMGSEKMSPWRRAEIK